MLKFLKKLIGLDSGLAKGCSGQHKITNAPVRKDLARVMRQVRNTRKVESHPASEDDLSTIRPYKSPTTKDSSKSSSFWNYSIENSCGDDD